MDQNEIMQHATDIVKIQAGVKPMTADEITAMLVHVARGIEVAAGGGVPAVESMRPALDPKKSIKEASITCLECGRSMKVITKKHLATHGITPAEYRAKYGYKKTQALACKSLARERRKTMQKSKLWERRKKPETPVQQ